MELGLEQDGTFESICSCGINIICANRLISNAFIILLEEDSSERKCNKKILPWLPLLVLFRRVLMSLPIIHLHLKQRLRFQIKM